MSENSDPKHAVQSMQIVQWEPGSATEAWQLAKYYQASQLLPKALSNIADVFVTIAAGRDFGWSPMQSMRGIYVVEGKPSLSADAMVGIAKQSKICKYFKMMESTAKIATYETLREGDPSPVKMSFTIEEATLAGLTGKKGPWQSYPARMLRNRCKSALCKEVYEELFFGTYEESEAEEIPRHGRRPTTVQSSGPIERELNPDPIAQSVAPSTQTGESQHNTITGEVTASSEEALAEKFAKQIAAAADLNELSKAGASIKLAAERGHITQDERAHLMPVYAEKLKTTPQRTA